MENSFEEYTNLHRVENKKIENTLPKKYAAIIFTDGGATNKGDGEYIKAGIGIYSPPESLIFGIGFNIGDNVSSNMAEYEAIIAAIKICIHIGVKDLHIKSDSQLCVRHIEKKCLNRKGYECSDPKLLIRLSIVEKLIKQLDSFDIEHISRNLNTTADALVRSATASKKPICLPSCWNSISKEYLNWDI